MNKNRRTNMKPNVYIKMTEIFADQEEMTEFFDHFWEVSNRLEKMIDKREETPDTDCEDEFRDFFHSLCAFLTFHRVKIEEIIKKSSFTIAEYNELLEGKKDDASN